MVLGGWLRGSAKPETATPAKTLEEERKELLHALKGIDFIMADDVEGADRRLHEFDSTYHKLGRGVTEFIQSLMGFEKDVMRAAAETLAISEAASWAEYKRAQRNASMYEGRLYSAGAEYALCHANSQLMSAVVGVLNESLTEAIKGFYKLRKAYVVLENIAAEEAKFLPKYGIAAPKHGRPNLRRVSMPGSFDETEFAESRNDSQAAVNEKLSSSKRSSPEDSDLEFVDADEAHPGEEKTTAYLGHTATNDGALDQKLEKLALNGNEPEGDNLLRIRSPSAPLDGPDVDFFKDPIDAFIHSTTNMCYGLLLLILSMVPPAFSKLLYIIGFKGDREQGIRLLWQATKFNNISGAIAGLALLGYYNGLLGFCDIILTDKEAAENDYTAYPKAKCETLVSVMKARYPESRLWRLEEARMAIGNKDLDNAVVILNGNRNSPMKQLVALNMFEKGLCTMAMHDYEVCKESFLECVDLNSWSHALYIFAAASAVLELFRQTRLSDPVAAEKYKAQATELFIRSSGRVGAKKFMAKQMPFDLYVGRKVQKWKERAKEWKLDLVDCIGVSPHEEMVYLWNGYKKMRPQDLERSLQSLDLNLATHPEKFHNDVDEIGVQSLLKGTVLRSQGKFDEARQLFVDDLVSKDRNTFKGHLRDDWSCPSAHYEMAVLAWQEKDLPGVDPEQKLEECQEWLHKVAKWETYLLDARIGMKVTTGIDTVKRYRGIA